MRLAIKISIRYILSGKGSTLLVSLVALAGITLSVSAVLLTMAVFAGFQKALKEKILSSAPHIIVSLPLTEDVSAYEEKLKDERIAYAYPIVVYQAILSNGKSFQSITVKGMRPEDIKMKERYLVEGKREGNLLGKGISDVMGVGVGDEVSLISPMGVRTPFGFLPKSKQIRIDGIFRTGTFDQDYMTLIMPMQGAKDFFGENWQLYGFEVFLKDPYKAQEVRRSLEEKMGPKVVVRSWVDLNAPLFNALEVEKVGIFFVLLLMVSTASFNITSLLFMKVREKVRDIAVLRTFGMEERHVFLIFVLQGVILGLVGIALALLLSVLGSYLINRYELIRVPADVYLMDHVPAHLELNDIIYTAVGAFFLSLLASLLPAYRAGKARVVEILRNE